MIEKKISYEINIEKPSKTKPVKQGGVFNYLGKQKTVNAPRHWRSSPKHPIAHLSYITKDEQKILIDLNLYGSLKGKPNKGPSGIMSLQGSGGGAGGGDGGGAGGGDGDSGPGGSDDGSGHGGPGPGGPGGPGRPGSAPLPPPQPMQHPHPHPHPQPPQPMHPSQQYLPRNMMPPNHYMQRRMGSMGSMGSMGGMRRW